MKKKKIVLFVFLLIGVLSLIFMYNKKINLNKKRIVNKNYAIYVKDSSSNSYVNSTNIPKGSYLLNEEKSFCENKGKIKNYDNINGKVNFLLKGSDKCTLYFEYDGAPTISNVNISGKTITATLTDDVELNQYAITTTLDEPTSWTSIEGKTYSLKITLNKSGTYYLWVKDSYGNVTRYGNALEIKQQAYELVLANTTLNSGTPDFTVSETSNKGLYKTEDDQGTSYYFRGAVNNNWVKFGKYTTAGLVRGFGSSTSTTYMEYSTLEECKSASYYKYNCAYAWNEGDDIYWRIIRINGDGSLRLIYSGVTAPTSSTSVLLTGPATEITKTKFNNSDVNTEYVGYQYVVGKQHGYGKCAPENASCVINGETIYNSVVKQELEKWYQTTTLYSDAETSTLVMDNPFCYDRSASTNSIGTPGEITPWLSTKINYYYGSNIRLYGQYKFIGSLKCINTADKFTVSTQNGNGALSYPVGLITADELAFAGTNNGGNNEYYLYTGQDYWTGSPYAYITGEDCSFTFIAAGGSVISTGELTSQTGIRPVISLSSDALISGKGTWDNPYVVN